MASLGGSRVLLFGGWDGRFAVRPGSMISAPTPGPIRPRHQSVRTLLACHGLPRRGPCAAVWREDASGLKGETWVYDLSANTWTNQAPAAAPSARYWHAMASLGEDQVLLFGGEDASGLEGETWVYDLSANTWTNQAPASGPSARYAHAMASLGGDQVLLFGGGMAAFALRRGSTTSAPTPGLTKPPPPPRRTSLPRHGLPRRGPGAAVWRRRGLVQRQTWPMTSAPTPGLTGPRRRPVRPQLACHGPIGGTRCSCSVGGAPAALTVRPGPMTSAPTPGRANPRQRPVRTNGPCHGLPRRRPGAPVWRVR